MAWCNAFSPALSRWSTSADADADASIMSISPVSTCLPLPQLSDGIIPKSFLISFQHFVDWDGSFGEDTWAFFSTICSSGCVSPRGCATVLLHRAWLNFVLSKSTGFFSNFEYSSGVMKRPNCRNMGKDTQLAGEAIVGV